MHCFAIAEAVGPVSISELALERYRARPIEVDDTGALSVRLRSGLRIVVAVTLCSDVELDPWIVVHGERGRAVLEYTTDRLRLPSDAHLAEVPGRTGLLANLLAHRSAPGEVPLLAPLERTAPFTQVIEAITADGPPTTIEPHWQLVHGPDRVVTVPGISAVLQEGATASSCQASSESRGPLRTHRRRECNKRCRSHAPNRNKRTPARKLSRERRGCTKFIATNLQTRHIDVPAEL